MLEDQSNQAAYYKDQYQVVVKEKDELRIAVEGFVRRNSSLDNNAVETNRSPSKAYKVKDLLLELENQDQEKRKLKVFLGSSFY